MSERGWIWVSLWALMLFAALALLGVFGRHGTGRRCGEHPAADGIITRAELQEVVDRANAIHAKMRTEPHAEYCHKRVDRLIEGVEAMTPGLKDRARVNALVGEAKR